MQIGGENTKNLFMNMVLIKKILKTFKKTLGNHLPIWNCPSDDFRNLK
jgi:hypothetical protein